MKNIFTLFLLILFLAFSNLCCYSKQSLNTFTISLQDVPQGVSSENDDGLSDGIIAAIALGSTFGGLGILSGIGYCFYKNSKGLLAGCACGQKCPYQTIDIGACKDVLADKKKYAYLMKASKKSILNPDYPYLVIPDIQIKPRTVNTVFFELPKIANSNINFRIIQASRPYLIENNIANLDSNIFTDPKLKNVKKSSNICKRTKL